MFVVEEDIQFEEFDDEPVASNNNNNGGKKEIDEDALAKELEASLNEEDITFD